MSHRFTSRIATGLAVFAFAAAPAFASDDHSKHTGHQAPAKPAATAQAASAMSEAEVRKVDKERGRITLKHGEIKNLEMPPMTMIFRVKDAAMLDTVKEGDKIGFTADKIGGQYTVTGMEKK